VFYFRSQPPAVPPRPGKKLMTRKVSFLEKMRNSARVKPKEKVSYLFYIGYKCSSLVTHFAWHYSTL